MSIRKVKGSEVRKLRGATQWDKVKSMSDEEVRKAAKLDLAAREFKEDELRQFRREKK